MRFANRSEIELIWRWLICSRPWVSTSGNYEALVEQLASRSGPLLAVCGKPDDLQGEVWSRQLGVWMYLPGIDTDSDIALLCGEARNILKKLGDHAAQLTM